MTESVAPATNRWGWAWLVGVVLLPLVQVVATGSLGILSRPFWLDEVHTAVLVADPSFSHAMRSLLHGADYNPPALYVLNRLVALAVGSSSPAVLRSVSLLAVLLGLAGIFMAVRRVYPAPVAAVASVAAWASPLLVYQAFEARFYAVWFAAIVWFCFALNLAIRRPGSIGPRLLVLLTSVLTCTVHYFGVFSLILVVLAQALALWRNWVKLIRLVPWMAAGPVALLGCIPLYLGQKRALSVPTWIATPNGKVIRDYLAEVYSPLILLLPIMALFATLMMRRDPEANDQPEEDARTPELAGLAGLLLLPPLLVAFSVLVQPATLARYALATLAAMSVAVAPLLARSHRLALGGVLVVYALLSTFAVMQFRSSARVKEADTTARLRVLADYPSVPRVFRDREELFRLWWRAGRPKEGWYFWDFGELDPNLPPAQAVERDVARNLHDWHGTPGLVDLRSLADRRVILVGFPESMIADLRDRGIVPSFRTIHPAFRIDEMSPREQPVVPSNLDRPQ